MLAWRDGPDVTFSLRGRPELPVGVPSGQSGPRRTAFVGRLRACFRQSQRRTAPCLEAILGQPCRAGRTVQLQNIVTDCRTLRPTRCVPPTTNGAGSFPRNRSSTIDARRRRKRDAQVVAVDVRGVTFHGLSRAADSRGHRVGRTADRPVPGPLVACDRAKMSWRLKRLQWCRAHLLRDFQNPIDTGPPAAKPLGRDLLKQTRLVFQQWHRHRGQLLTRTGLKRVTAPCSPRSRGGGGAVVTRRLRAPVGNSCHTATGCGWSATTRASNPPIMPANAPGIPPSSGASSTTKSVKPTIRYCQSVPLKSASTPSG